MKPVFDTNVFIEHEKDLTDNDIEGMALSAVVLYELTATTIDHSVLKKYRAWFRSFSKDSLLLVPTGEDWWEVARVVSRLRHGQKSTSRGKTPKDPHASRLQNDALIARTAYMSDYFVVTSDIDDFLRLRAFMKFDVISADEYFSL